MEVVPGIHLVEGVRGANCYLVVTQTGTALIDTGLPGNGKRIVNYIKSLGMSPPDVSYVILTHADIDHIGSAAETKQLTGAQLAIHVGDALILSGQKASKTAKGPLGPLLKLMGPLMRFQTVKPDVVLDKDPEEICGLKVIHTPGHTSGSISLYMPGKAVFVGDALRGDSKGNLRPPSTAFTKDMTLARTSLTSISELEFDILLPGHGLPVVGEASVKLKRLLTRLT